MIAFIPDHMFSIGASVAEGNRMERRKAQTRAALISAAQGFLAEGRLGVSIRDITSRADVGFGSFYNHFDSKEELFDEAVLTTLDAFEEWRMRIVAGLDDPAEIFATSFRLTGRVPRRLPTVAQLILRAGAPILSIDRGIRPGALRDLQRGVAEGCFLGDPEQLLMIVGGGLLGLIQMVVSRPDLDDGQVADDMTRLVLRTLGLSEAEAERLCALPLPDIDLPLAES